MKREIRVTKIQRAVLQTLKVAGVLSVALLAPNALRMLKIFDKNIGRKKTHSINVSKNRLINKGLIRNKDGFLELTKKGEGLIGEIENTNYKAKVKKPKRWDKKWRIITFDIPTARNRARDQIRMVLNDIGFIQLQRSVWVSPYDCEDLISLLKIDFKIGKNLIYVVADKIENDQTLKKRFDLK